MDACGTVYGSKEFSDDCIFNEAMEQHHYNTYSSGSHSNPRRILYLAFNRHGQPRKIQIPANRPLGKLATYTKSLTQTVSHDRVEKLITRLFGPSFTRHGLKQLCEKEKRLIELTSKKLKSIPKCNLKAKQNPNTKKKRNKRKCRPDEQESDICFKPNPLLQQGQPTRRKNPAGKTNKQILKCDDNEDCKTTKNLKKNKTQPNGHLITNTKKPRQNKQPLKKNNRLATKTTTIEPMILSSTPSDDEEMYNDDAMVSSSTEFHDDDEWEETSSIPSHSSNHHISQFIDDEDFGFDAKK